MNNIEAIAEKAGVSRGTVDRVLHDRGRVSPETEAKVRAAIRELDFQPNSLGRAFYMARQKNKIGVLVAFREPDFQRMIMAGVNDGIAYAKQHGIEVVLEYASPDDPEAYLQALRRLLAQGLRGLILRGIESEAVDRCLRGLDRKKIYIAAINDDISRELRDCFVGQESYRSGACAAHLMQQISPEGGCTLLVGVSRQHHSSEQRLEGFAHHFRDVPEFEMRLPATIYGNGNQEQTYRLLRQALAQEPYVTGIYVSGAGLSGAARAVEEAGLAGRIKMIGFDVTESNLACMERGVVQFVIDQNPYMQGYKGLQVLTDAIFENKSVETEYYEVGIQIRNLYNTDVL